MFARAVHWIGLAAIMAALAWLSGVAMDVAKAMLTGKAVSVPLLAPSTTLYGKAAYLAFFVSAIVVDWRFRQRRNPAKAPLLNGARYNLPYLLAAFTGATRAGIILFTFGLAGVALPAATSVPPFLSLAGIPWPLQGVIAYVAGSFAQYWYHRFMHRS